LEINKNKESQHYDKKTEKIAFGIASLGIILIGILTMRVSKFWCSSNGSILFWYISYENSKLISSGDGNYLC